MNASDGNGSTDRAKILRLFSEISQFPPGEQEARLVQIDDKDIRAAVQSRLGKLGELSAVRSLEDEFSYEIKESIGNGAYGTVYRAKQKGINRTVAFKIFSHGSLQSREATERMRRAAESAAKLDHSGILRIIEPGIRDGKFFLVTEFVDGETLAEHLNNLGPLHANEAAGLMCKISDAIAHAHDRQIIHRDLKPSNILLDKAGEPKVADFDLIHELSSEEGEPTASSLVGTPSYMSPEQASGRIVGYQSDVYSLGVMLYEMLTGKRPHEAASVEETLQDVRERDVVSPRTLNARIPLDLETICLKCLRKSPGRRYPSARELYAELKRYLDGEPILARRTSRFERVLKWAKREPSMATLGVALILAVVSAFTGISWQAWQAEKARRASDDNLVTALDAIDYFNREIVNTDLANVPGMAPLRKKILAKNAEFYESLLAKNEQTAALMSGGTIYLSLGDIRHALGELDEAEQAYRSAIALYGPNLKPGFDASNPSRLAVLRAWNSLANLKNDLGQYDECQDILNEFDVFLRAYPASHREQTEYMEAFGTLRLNQARLNAKTGDLAEAKNLCREALESYQWLASQDPRKAATVSSLAGCWFIFGNVLLRTESKEAAENAYQTGLALQEELTQEFPDNVGFKRNVATSYRTMARLYKFQKRTDTAIEYYQKAYDRFVELVDHHPTIPEYRHQLAETLIGISALVDSEQAIPLLEKAVSCQKLSCEMSTGNSAYSSALRNHLNQLAFAYADSGYYAKAVSVDLEFLTFADRAADFIFGAYLLCECRDLALADDDIPRLRRDELAKEYRQACVKSLENAQEKGLLSAEVMALGLFDSVRDSDTFMAIVNSVLNEEP